MTPSRHGMYLEFWICFPSKLISQGLDFELEREYIPMDSETYLISMSKGHVSDSFYPTLSLRCGVT